MSEYKGSIELLSGLKPANNQDFPLLRAEDVLMPDGARLSDVTYYGYRYSDAYKVIDISNERDKSINMYLFENGDGYDAVVKGPGHMLDFYPEGEVYLCTEDGVWTGFQNKFTLIASPCPDLLTPYGLAKRYFPLSGATPGKYYLNQNNINDVYRCVQAVSETPLGRDQVEYVQITDTDHFVKEEIYDFFPGQYCYSGRLYRYEDLGFDRDKIYRLRVEEDVTEIGAYFMYGAHNLRNLSFAKSENIKLLNKCAFAYTAIRGNFSFPNLEQDSINQVFRQCPNLEGVGFNQRINTVHKYSFEKCLSLKFVNNVCYYGYLHIDDYAFMTCAQLRTLDIDTQVTTLGKSVFANCPDDATVGYTDPITHLVTNSGMRLDMWQPGEDTHNYHNWRDEDMMPGNNFVWSNWLDGGLIDPRTGKANLPVGDFTRVLKTPETDYQYNPEYYQWSGDYIFNSEPYAFPLEIVGKLPAAMSDMFYALFHVFNILHPNSQYDDYMEFVATEILNSKLTIDERLMSILSGEIYAKMDDISEPTENDHYKASEDLLEVLEYANTKYNTTVRYAIEEEISPVDLPITLKNVQTDSASDAAIYRGEGTSWWATCHALGLYYQQYNLADEQDRPMIPILDPASGNEVILNRPAVAKELLLGSIKRGVPGVVIRDVLDNVEELLQDQTYVVIGYDNNTDKFLILESAWAYPSDIKPFTYWIKFEDLLLPTRYSAVITFTRKEELEVSNADILALQALVSEANRNVLENGVAFKRCMDMMQQILDNMVTHSDQDLTEAQKAQARDNIDAVDENQVLTLIQENLPPNGGSIED